MCQLGIYDSDSQHQHTCNSGYSRCYASQW